jgi:formylglycine-generating enzyme required for sulfatase activity
MCRRSLLMVSMLVAGGACSENKSCPTPDLATTDRGPSGNELGAPLCQKDKVQCKADELNAFGVCLPPSSMVAVAGGELAMGKTETGKAYSPEHKVTLKAFSVDRTEVSVAQYKACVDCGVCKPPLRDGSNTGREPYYGNESYANYPAIYIGWIDAKAYCEGIGKRLPTEAEWEMAARGSAGNEYPWGSTAPTPADANFQSAANDTLPVTDYEKGKSPCGALNMAGNVWEWVADSYDPSYYSSSPTADPKGPATSVIKATRGGGFNSTADNLKTYVRVGNVETAAFSYLGFRCAKDK